MILALGPQHPVVAERLAGYGEIVQDDLERLPEAVAIVARAAPVVDAAMIEAATALRVIGRSGVGSDNVDVEAAARRGIPVVITPGANTAAVAESALAMVLHLVKRLGPLTALVREGRWAEREAIVPGDLDGATLAVVGLGAIGGRLAALAGACGMEVVAYDPVVGDAPPGVKLAASLHDALAAADAISLHAPLTEATHGLIGADALEHVKPGAVLVNCARGGLVDLDAAHAALRDGRLGGVGLDVFDPEPAEPHPLLEHPDVVLTPHVAGLSARASRRVFGAMADGVAAVLDGGTAPHVANPEALD